MVKISLDVFICLGSRYTDVVGERECADTVNYAEIDRLCTASHQRSYRLNRHIENLRSRYCVDIVAVVEGGYHCFVVRNVRENTKLDLRIVGINKYTAVLGDKEFSKLTSDRCSDGNILQIGFCRRNSSGLCFGLVEC